MFPGFLQNAFERTKTPLGSLGNFHGLNSQLSHLCVPVSSPRPPGTQDIIILPSRLSLLTHSHTCKLKHIHRYPQISMATCVHVDETQAYLPQEAAFSEQQLFFIISKFCLCIRPQPTASAPATAEPSQSFPFLALRGLLSFLHFLLFCSKLPFDYYPGVIFP